MSNFSLLGIFAHPDDEGSASGCLAQYASQGAQAYVVCTTRGDGVDAKSKDPAITTREALGKARMQELICACEMLGINPPIFLGYQDGEVDKVPTEDAAIYVARLLRKLQPAIVITHGPEGGYGHPDHIAVCQFVTRAFDLASEPAVDLGLAPFAPSKLYYSAFPRSFREKVPGFRDRRADIRGEQLGFMGVEDEKITTAVNIREWVSTKTKALSCHRTQFEIDPETNAPKTFATGVPEEVRLELFGHERFVLEKTNVPRNGPESDLFAGLR